MVWMAIDGCCSSELAVLSSIASVSSVSMVNVNALCLSGKESFVIWVIIIVLQESLPSNTAKCFANSILESDFDRVCPHQNLKVIVTVD